MSVREEYTTDVHGVFSILEVEEVKVGVGGRGQSRGQVFSGRAGEEEGEGSQEGRSRHTGGTRRNGDCRSTSVRNYPKEYRYGESLSERFSLWAQYVVGLHTQHFDLIEGAVLDFG